MMMKFLISIKFYIELLILVDKPEVRKYLRIHKKNLQKWLRDEGNLRIKLFKINFKNI